MPFFSFYKSIAGLILIALYTTFLPEAQAQQPSASPSMAQILTEVKKNTALLIDVRTPEEYKEGHFKQAVNIDYKSPSFTENVTKLPKDKTLYLYCRSGNRSGKGRDILMQQGYLQVFNIGGYDSLRQSISK